MKNCALLTALPLLALTSPVSAQTPRADEADCAQLPENGDNGEIAPECRIVVIGTLYGAISERTEAIDAVTIGTGRVETALIGVPGLQNFRRADSRSANPTGQGITLRGLGGNAASRALLFLDDVPQVDPFGNWVSWPAYDAVNLASVRVRRGGGQVAAGPGALGGVIEMDSVQFREAAHVDLAYGSRNGIDAKARLSTRVGAGSFSLGGSYARGDGFTPIIAGQRGSADRPAAYEQAGLSLRGVAPIGASTELQANLRAFTDSRDRGVDFSDNSNQGVDASVRLVDRDSDWQWAATGYIQIRDFASQFPAVAADRNSVSLTLDQFATPSTGTGLRFEMRPPVIEGGELRLGGEWRRSVGETREDLSYVAGQPTRMRTAGGEIDLVGGFAELNYEPVSALTLSAGGRFDRWTIREGFRREVNIGGSVRSDDRFADRRGSQWTGRAGFGWNIDANFTLRGSAYRAWRLPSLNELYRPFRVGADATAANELLRPEIVKGIDAAVEVDAGALDLGVTLFRNRLSDAIANVTLGQGPGNFPGVGFVAAGGVYRQRQNLDAIETQGIEADASIKLAEGVTARLGYAFVDAEVRGSGVAAPLSGLRPAQVPRHFASATLAYDRAQIAADATLRYIGAQFEDDANSRLLADALTLDLGLSVRITEAFALVLRGENLFDARVETTISSNGIVERATPRTLWLGLRWNFD